MASSKKTYGAAEAGAGAAACATRTAARGRVPHAPAAARGSAARAPATGGASDRCHRHALRASGAAARADQVASRPRSSTQLENLRYVRQRHRASPVAQVVNLCRANPRSPCTQVENLRYVRQRHRASPSSTGCQPVPSKSPTPVHTGEQPTLRGSSACDHAHVHKPRERSLQKRITRRVDELSLLHRVVHPLAVAL